MSAPASPILLALAQLRLTRPFPACLTPSFVGGLLRPIVAAASLRGLFGRLALWLAGQLLRHRSVQRAVKSYRDRFVGRRRALLIGITSSPDLVDESELYSPAPEVAHSPGYLPPLSRAGSKNKKKKSQGKKAGGAQNSLKGPHHDVECMRKLLIDVYGYHPDDIVTLIDDEKPGHLQPSRANIIGQIKHLVKGVRHSDKLFFHYAGHADQVETQDLEEEDGMNEYIITSDGHAIMDNILFEELIGPLANIKCKLTAVFDCCHSGSLLDLPHIHCNNVYVPWLNKGKRRTKTMWANRQGRRDAAMVPAGEFLSSNDDELQPGISFTPWCPSREHRRPVPLKIDTGSTCTYPSPPGTVETREGEFNVPDINVEVVESPKPQETFVSPAHFTASPAVTFKWCDGTCRDDPFSIKCAEKFEETKVICLSASKDGELSWEDSDGRSMTQYLVKNLTPRPDTPANDAAHPTLHNLLTTISHDIHQFYVNDLHCSARSFKKKMSDSGRADDPLAKTAEMHNFQNPQLSSFVPLNMEEPFDP